MPDKKQPLKKQTLVHTITCGGIIADIHAHQSPAGFQYLSFSLERFYLNSTGRQARGSAFFAPNAEEISRAAREASQWIMVRQQADMRVDQEVESDG